MNRVAGSADRQLDLGRLRAMVERRVVRHGQRQIAQALREVLQRMHRQAEHGLETQQRLDQRVAVEVPAIVRRREVGYVLKCGFINPHRHVASIDQAGVVGRPVPDLVAGLRLARLAFVLAHRLGGKKSRVYAENRIVNRTPPRLFARKRQAVARPPDECDNALYRVKTYSMAR